MSPASPGVLQPEGSRFSPNFAFLAAHDPHLARLPTWAEVYLHDDPNTALLKLRQFGEVLVRLALARAGVDANSEEDQVDLIRRLRDTGVLPATHETQLHELRTRGNDAMHSLLGTHHAAFQGLLKARALGVWFHRIWGKPDFQPGPFATPKRPEHLDTELRTKLDELRRERDETRDALRTTEARADKVIEERDTALSLAEELEAALEQERQRFMALLRRAQSQVTKGAAPRREEVSFRALLAGRDSEDVPDYDHPGVWIEQQSHLTAFVGRAAELGALLHELATGSRGGHHLVVASAGQGKSALLARLASLAAGIGEPSSSVREGHTPVLLHMSKSLTDQRQILQFFLWQTSSFLGTSFPKSVYTGSVVDLRDRLVTSLGSMVERFGRALVIVDALDELVRDPDQPGRDLLFIPDMLPVGVTLVASARPDAGLLAHLRRRLPGLTELVLKPLPPSDVADFLEARTSAGIYSWLDHTVGIERVLERTGGMPLLLRRVAEVAPRIHAKAGSAQSNVTSTDWVPATVAEVFEDVYREVVHPARQGGKGGTRLRELLLGILATAKEPIGVAEIVGVLKAVGYPPDSAAVRAALDRMSEHLVAFDGRAYALFHDGLRQYVIERIGADGGHEIHMAFARWLESSNKAPGYYAKHLYAHLSESYALARLAEAPESASSSASAIIGTLTNPRYVRAAIEGDRLFNLLAHYDDAVRLLDAVPQSAVETFHGWRAFLNENVTVLTERPNLLVQQAMNAEAASVREAASLLGGTASGPVFRRVWSRLRARPSSLIRYLPAGDVFSVAGFAGIAVSSPSRRAASLRCDGEVLTVWDLDTGAELVTHRLHDTAYDMALSPSSRLAAISGYYYRYPSGEDGEEQHWKDPVAVIGWLAVLDITSGALAFKCETELDGYVSPLTFSSDERHVYFCTGKEGDANIKAEAEGRLIRLEIQTGQLDMLSEGSAPFHAMALSDDGRWLLTGAGWHRRGRRRKESGEAVLWDLRGTPQRKASLQLSSPVMSIATGLNGEFVLALESGAIHIWKPGASCRLVIPRTRASVTRVQVVAGGQIALVAAQEDFRKPPILEYWDLTTGRCLGGAEAAGTDVTAFTVTHQGTRVLMATQSHVAVMRTGGTSGLPLQGELNQDSLHPAVCLPSRKHYDREGRVVATVGPGGAKLWDVQAEEVIDATTFADPADDEGEDRSAYVAPGGALWVIAQQWIEDLFWVLECRRRGPPQERGIAIMFRARLQDIVFSLEGRLGAFVTEPLTPEERREKAKDWKALQTEILKTAKSKEESAEEEHESFGLEGGNGTWPPLTEHLSSGGRYRLTIVDWFEGRVLCCIDLDELTIKDVCFSPDGLLIAVVGHASLGVWRTNDGSLVKWVQEPPKFDTPFPRVAETVAAVLRGPQPGDLDDIDLDRDFEPGAVRFTPDGQHLVASGRIKHWYRLGRRWQTTDFSEVEPIPLAADREFEFTADGRHMVYPDGHGVTLVGVGEGKEVAHWPVEGNVLMVGIRDEGRIVVHDSLGNVDVIEGPFDTAGLAIDSGLRPEDV